MHPSASAINVPRSDKQTDDSVLALVCEDIWKIYGNSANEALRAIREQALTKQEVSDRYGCVVGVAGVSFAVSSSESFCIMGLSGGGKSTLLRHINRLIEPTAGRIYIYGDDISEKSPKELRKTRAEDIGMVFQDNALFPHRTVLSNIGYGMEVRGVPRASRRLMAQQALELVQLHGWGNRYPHELSGGMQQRVGLARAIAGKPRILLLDEPFGSLDPLIRRQLQTEFRDLLKSLAISCVFITHDLDEAIALGDRIAIMKDGQFLQVGTPQEIILRPQGAYIAEFVRGISKLKLLNAGAIMEPIVEPGGNARRISEHCTSVSVDTNIDTLIEIVLSSSEPVIVRTANGDAVGIVDCRALLRGIKGAGH